MNVFKGHNITEYKIHEQLYNNIYLLTLTYPVTEEFKVVFKKDMFYKNNKAAFHQIVYYLLTTLNPAVIKQKITIWPIYEIKLESQFRNEVMKYINELNTLYEDANIPMIMTTHLLSPGGAKFVKCMLKLSQLVMYQHLQKNVELPETILCPFKPNKNRDHALNSLNRLQCITHELNREIFNINANFEADFNKYTVEANYLIEKQNEVTQKMSEYKKLLENKEESEDCMSNEEFQLKFEQLQEVAEQINSLKLKFEYCSNLTDYLSSKDICLDYKPGEITVPKEISHILNPNAHNISLLKLLEAFLMFMEHQHFQLNRIDTQHIHTNLKVYTELNELFETLIGNYNEIKENFVEYLSNINTTINQSTTKANKSDSTLALPLLESPTV